MNKNSIFENILSVLVVDNNPQKICSVTNKTKLQRECSSEAICIKKKKILIIINGLLTDNMHKSFDF